MGQPSFQTENVSAGEGDPKSHGSETRWTGLSTNHHRDSHAHCVDKKDIIEENVPEVGQSVKFNNEFVIGSSKTFTYVWSHVVLYLF
ncbi:hypothetical protein RHGRI_026014 [Rhododendron griersonianum]|uniref:Uncharacterized protein n=1 Tax=Rhododendron griersonianum TaxID=479676 RepID=A0AAV6IR52_9ERIC|nr:hypothetical protein RHGRI_026014 [Rhododendron griersonianum]